MAQPFENRTNKEQKEGMRIQPYASAGGAASIKPQNVTYTITNDTTDRVFDADTAVLTEVSDVLATLIRDLQAAGIIR